MEKYEYILNNFKVLVIPRNNEKINIKSSNIILTDVKADNLSSTYIRNNIKSIKNIDDLIDKKVLDYIKERNFYERNSWITYKKT